MRRETAASGSVDVFCHIKRPSTQQQSQSVPLVDAAPVFAEGCGLMRCSFCLTRLPQHSLKAKHHLQLVCDRQAHPEPLPQSPSNDDAECCQSPTEEAENTAKTITLRPRKPSAAAATTTSNTPFCKSAAKKSKACPKAAQKKKAGSRLGPPLKHAYHPLLMTKHPIDGDPSLLTHKVDFWAGIKDAHPDQSTEIADLPTTDPEIIDIFRRWNVFILPLTQRPFKVTAIEKFLKAFLGEHKDRFNPIKLRHFILCFVKYKIIAKHQALELFGGGPAERD